MQLLHDISRQHFVSTAYVRIYGKKSVWEQPKKRSKFLCHSNRTWYKSVVIDFSRVSRSAYGTSRSWCYLAKTKICLRGLMSGWARKSSKDRFSEEDLGSENGWKGLLVIL